MKHRAFCLVMIVALMFCGVVALGQGSLGPKPKKALAPDDYKPQTLKEVVAEESNPDNRQQDEANVVVHGDLRPSRVRAQYAGRSRPLPKIKKAVLYRWAQRYAGAPQHYIQPYQTELLFRDEGVEYWLAIRKESVAEFEKQLKKGDAVDLFLVRLGGAVTDHKWESLLLVESFQKPKLAVSPAISSAPFSSGLEGEYRSIKIAATRAAVQKQSSRGSVSKTP